MSNMKNKKLTTTQLQYNQLVTSIEPKRPILTNCIRAFLIGGLICTIGQFLQWAFITYFNFDEKSSVGPTSLVLIFTAALLTGLGVYDHLAQWAGAGSAVPITGFANSIASASIEHKSEGFVLGVAGNMFQLAGAIIVYGVFSAFVVATIKLIITWLGAM
ncbi:stage V sporulation protein AC [Clostridium saccharoperbutylacetonicum]|uniref:Stage V sporulation protein AC n=1 Tax=Clostridium saccharoperbutylacetonicum N1-4(HMT) TaxID=931276 RepID=M1LXT5_9CLOT|nr:stage V sporulation protein AC [Clostridium saccharoperbutylacetonicum]AGF58085.1 stage V sporulation protein AC [Clostridium saccharoperbutylacetonicum N1-4(HMT)]AQR96775.1 SpoVA protein [Clostridium saccharoperbutylacetonicum]NRT61141.1 stage V sporulation protein AC [Clostridium saccharoperbutylacetonicum]NSB24456.1 stage V sporulation protein AC [Clostridium saccharoperbutylacetonicum]NSB32653.1 stage V sporulation protein AC [Clostridium saccharoperbutylacetonicum]